MSVKISSRASRIKKGVTHRTWRHYWVWVPILAQTMAVSCSSPECIGLIFMRAKSISSSGAKLARCKTPNQRAVDDLRAPFSSGHSQKLKTRAAIHGVQTRLRQTLHPTARKHARAHKQIDCKI
jgi:hypothetical protein